jgi:hypothetical protein
MAGKVTLSGILLDPLNKPLPGVHIELKSVKTGDVISGLAAEFVTNQDGSYSIEVPVGSYKCAVITEGRETSLPGYVNVYDYSGSGTLNEYLYAPCQEDGEPMFIVQWEMIRQEINGAKLSVDDSLQSVKGYTERAEKAAEDAERFAEVSEHAISGDNVFFANPSDPTGTIQGIAGTNTGDLFTVVYGSGSEIAYSVYLNNNGVANLKYQMISKDAYDSLREKINSLGIVSSNSKISGVSFAVVDENGKSSWLQVGEKGEITDYTADKIKEKIDITGLEEKVNQLVEELSGISFVSSNSKISGVSFAVVDENGKSSWLQVGEKGEITDYTADKIKEKIDIGDLSKNFESGNNITGIGDSLTAGAGAPDGSRYMQVLQNILSDNGYDSKVTNYGVGGETSWTIAARTNAIPFRILPIDDSKPGYILAGNVKTKIKILDRFGKVLRPMLQGDSSQAGWMGQVDGIPGYMGIVKPNGGNTWDNSNYYTFTPYPPLENDYEMNRPCDFHKNSFDALANDIYILWLGQNNGGDDDRAISDARAIINSSPCAITKFIIMPRPTSTDDIDLKFFSEFGNNIIPIRKYMIEYGLDDAGLTPTEQDLIDINAGVVPTSLRADSVHFNSYGHKIIAEQVFKKLKELKFIKK